MKIYLAGTPVSNPDEEIKLQSLFKQGHKLHSYFHCSDGFEKNWFLKNKRNNVDLFLDSGAFSAWTKNVKIDILEYAEFIQKNNRKLSLYSNLDVIGNASATYKNQIILEKEGLKPIPVFHFGEDFKWLKKYIEEGREYIALGGLVGAQAPDKFLNKCFSEFICGKDGYPKVKVHGFGLTRFDIMFRYPWYSVDSSSWVVIGRVGDILIPQFRNGQYDFSKFPNRIAVSGLKPSIKETGKHLFNLSPIRKKIFLNYLEESGFSLGKSEFKIEPQTYGLKENEKWASRKPKTKTEKRKVEIILEEGVSNSYKIRDEVNVTYYLELEKHFPEYPTKFLLNKKQTGLFATL